MTKRNNSNAFLCKALLNEVNPHNVQTVVSLQYLKIWQRTITKWSGHDSGLKFDKGNDSKNKKGRVAVLVLCNSPQWDENLQKSV